MLHDVGEKGRDFVSTEEILSEVEELPGFESELDLVRCISKDKRHAEQIDYLAKEHLSSLGRISIGTDNHSVLCLLAGEEGCFFVWEMFDAELSTYLWKSTYSLAEITRDADLYTTELQRVLKEIESCPVGRRNKYKAGKPDGFSEIEHDYENEGFDAWLGKLNRSLGRLF
jgi:hypothetical protein